jgi:KUP system potassium uptake protein
MNSAILNPSQPRENKSLLIAALGVVFGDIGTSPLYTMKAAFGGAHAVEPTPDNIRGILSLIFWALWIIISLKYVAIMMRADNRGEGGIVALLSLIMQKVEIGPRLRLIFIFIGLAGTSLFYGDGIIAPAISVLSAVEGLKVLEPELEPYVLPIALGVLIGLFSFQRRGTAQVGALFGPIMMIWFGSLAAFGLLGLARAPEVLAAINPVHAIRFFAAHQCHALMALGAVVLAVTGGEALYADMGHFGRGPIRKAWFYLVLPALLINYFGQGALLLRDASAVHNPFYLLIPPGGLPLMILVATLVTVVASQAVISGTFSLTSQAIQLGFCPRLTVRHTSEEERGQIYVPWINWALMLGIIGLMLGFRSSSNLAAAYGIAVTGTMAIDSILAFAVMFSLWRWKPWAAILIGGGFLVVDMGFLTANASKIVDGGWFPLLIGLAVFLLLTTWKQGRALLLDNLGKASMPIHKFLESLPEHAPTRVPGTAVFMTSSREGVPHALLHNLKHNKVLHETVVLMTVDTENLPRVAPDKRREVRKLGDGFYQVVLHYGFKETPDIPRALRSCSRDLDISIADTTFFLSRQTLIPISSSVMSAWRLKLFVGMARNTTSAISFFRIPPDRVVEIGVQVAL